MLKHYLGGRKQLDSMESDASRQAATGMKGWGQGGGREKNGRKTELGGEAFSTLQGAPDCVQYVYSSLWLTLTCSFSWDRDQKLVTIVYFTFMTDVCDPSMLFNSVQGHGKYATSKGLIQ